MRSRTLQRKTAIRRRPRPNDGDKRGRPRRRVGQFLFSRAQGLVPSQAVILTRLIAWTSLLAGFALLGLGSYISSSGFGLAIPDWPLSNGHLVPPQLVAGIAWEFYHRVLAAATLLLALLLAVLVMGHANPRVASLANLAAVTVALQVFVGGIGVLSQFPWLLKVVHALLAQVFVGVSAGVVALLGMAGSDPTSGDDADARDLARIRAFCSMLLLQIAAGAVVRHSDSGGVFALSLLLHILLAVGVAVSGFTTGLKIASQTAGTSRRLCYTLVGGVALQLVMGMLVLFNRPGLGESGQPSLSYVSHAGTHLVLGALLLSCATALYLRLARTETV